MKRRMRMLTIMMKKTSRTMGKRTRMKRRVFIHSEVLISIDGNIEIESIDRLIFKYSAAETQTSDLVFCFRRNKTKTKTRF